MSRVYDFISFYVFSIVLQCRNVDCKKLSKMNNYISPKLLLNIIIYKSFLFLKNILLLCYIVFECKKKIFLPQFTFQFF